MKIAKQIKGDAERAFASFSLSHPCGISGFTDNRLVAQAQIKTIQVIQRVGGETSGYEDLDSALILLLQKGREVNKIKKQCGTDANVEVLNYLDQSQQRFDTMVQVKKDQTLPFKQAYEEAESDFKDKNVIYKSHKNTIAQLTQNLSRIRGNLTTAQANLATAQNNQGRVKAQIDKLTLDVNACNDRITQLNGKTPILEADLDTATLVKNTALSRYRDMKKLEETRTFDKYKEDLKGNQVKYIYAPYLKSISLSKSFLVHIAPKAKNEIVNVIKTDEEAIVTNSQNANDINRTQFKSAFETKVNSVQPTSVCDSLTIGIPQIAQIQTGEDAFKQNPLPAVEETKIRDLNKRGTLPQLYTKKGKAGSQYIKDDLGNFVRRFAYMEKNFWQLMDFMETGNLSGETQAIKKMDPTQSKVSEIAPDQFENESLKGDDDIVVASAKGKAGADIMLGNQIAVAYLHQWKGSGKRQRGVSLTATEKDNAVFGNAGESFRNPEFSAKFKIDLLIAKTKENDADSNNLLMSHYAPGSSTRKAPFLDQEGHFADPAPLSDYSYKYEYEASVLKNRELFLQYVDSASVVEIVVRNGADTKIYGRDGVSPLVNIKDEPYYKSYIAGKNQTQAPTGADFSQAHFDKGVQWKTDFNAGLLKGQQDFGADQSLFPDKDAIFKSVFKQMNFTKELPYWQGLASGLLSSWQAQQAQPLLVAAGGPQMNPPQPITSP